MATAKAKTAARSRSKVVADDGARGGFTIIEVVLVLAIAGLIFLMVFIALPAMQRAQRDTQRRNDLARVSTAITQYQTNNNGKLPANGTCAAVENGDEVKIADLTGAGCTLITKYLNSVNSTNTEFIDPDGWSYGMSIADYSAGTTSGGTTTGATTGPTTLDHVVYIYKKAKCNGEEVVGSSNSRDFAVMYKLEGSGTYCQGNNSGK